MEESGVKRVDRAVGRGVLLNSLEIDDRWWVAAMMMIDDGQRVTTTTASRTSRQVD
jgi:hypothetical protein